MRIENPKYGMAIFVENYCTIYNNIYISKKYYSSCRVFFICNSERFTALVLSDIQYNNKEKCESYEKMTEKNNVLFKTST